MYFIVSFFKLKGTISRKPPTLRQSIETPKIYSKQQPQTSDSKKISHSEKLMKVRKRLKVVQQKNQRLSSKVTSWNAIVKALKENYLKSTNCAELLERNFTGIPLELLKERSKMVKEFLILQS